MPVPVPWPSAALICWKPPLIGRPAKFLPIGTLTRPAKTMERPVIDPNYNWEQHYPEDPASLAKYLERSGHRLICRLDMRMTCIEEVKKAAVLISELNKTLQVLAYDSDRDESLRVMMARDAMQSARIALKYMRPKAQRFTAKKNTTRSVSQPRQVGNLDKPWKGPSSV